MEKVGNKRQWIYCIMIVMFPILYQYDFIFSNLGVLILFLYSLLLFLAGRKMLVEKFLFIFALIYIIEQILPVVFGVYSLELWAKQSLQVVMMISMIGIIRTDRTEQFAEKLYSVYKIVGIISVLGIFYQTIQVYILGNSVSMITFLPMLNYDNVMLNYNRPCSIFTEPSAFATFIIPLLLLALYRNEFRFSMIISIAIAASTSTSGIIMMIFVWAYAMIAFKKRISLKIWMLFLIGLVLMFFLTSDIFSFALEKTLTIGSTTSDYTRLTKGWVTYWELPIKEKLIGVGQGYISEFMINTGTRFSWLSNAALQSITRWNYQSTAGGIFVDCGFLIGILFYMFIFRMFEKGNGISNAIVCLFILLTIFGNTFFNSVFVFYILLYVSYDRNYYKKRSYSLKIKFYDRTDNT